MHPVKKLLTYRYAEIIHDLTIEFNKRFILNRLSNLGQKPDFRQADQMNQAARSGKQNIVEGVGQSQTSSKGFIKLLGVTKASLEELLTDYEDFLRQNNLEIYQKSDPRVTRFRQTAFRLTHLSNLSDLGNLIEKPKIPENPQEAANFLLTLCHQVTYLLHRQIQSAEQKFISEGGVSERLFRERIKKRVN